MERTRKILLPVLALAILSGCTSYKTVEPPRNTTGPMPVVIGETVRVRTNDGQVFEEQLINIDPDSLVMRETRVFYKDIDTVEVKRKTRAAKAVHGTAEFTSEVLILAAWLYGFVIAADLLDAALDTAE